MMEIILYIYFAVNIFMAGYQFNEDSTWESVTFTWSRLVFNLFFGSCLLILYPLSILFLPIYDWVMNEVGFQYKFYFTKYWENILVEDKYKTAEEKIQEVKKISETSSKQIARHAKKVYNKYGN